MSSTVVLKTIPIDAIIITASNPRSDPDADLDGLAASLGTPDQPRLAQPPLVEDLGGDTYRLLAGERRVRAARLAGWKTIECLVHPVLSPIEAHELRMVENMHRRDLHPLDEAYALKIAWLAANARAMGLEQEVDTILRQELSPRQTLDILQIMLEANGFTPTRPLVQWAKLLKRLGLDINPENRKKTLALLGISDRAQTQIKDTGLNKAALRDLASLSPDDQERLVEEVSLDPNLERKVRNIIRQMRDSRRSLAQVLQEMRAGSEGRKKVVLPPSPTKQNSNNQEAEDQVVGLLAALNHFGLALSNLNLDDLSNLPAPWNQYASEALQDLKNRLETLSLRR